MSQPAEAVDELTRAAREYAGAGFTVHAVAARQDEDRDGEPIIRLALLLDEPPGDSWDVDQVSMMRLELGRKAAELGLPRISLTLVPQGEADVAELFAAG